MCRKLLQIFLSRYITGIPTHSHTLCHVIIFRDNMLTQNCCSITCARREYNKATALLHLENNKLPQNCISALGHSSISAPVTLPRDKTRVSTPAHGSPTHVAMPIHSLCVRKYVSELASLRSCVHVNGFPT